MFDYVASLWAGGWRDFEGGLLVFACGIPSRFHVFTSCVLIASDTCFRCTWVLYASQCILAAVFFLLLSPLEDIAIPFRYLGDTFLSSFPH